MSATPTPTIPYEKQSDLETNRQCGAAALSMVYGSLGRPVAQAEIWPRIARHNRSNTLAAATHLIARDALDRGFAALAVQARSPLLALRQCQEHGIRAILNHRLREDMGTGHYTVFVDLQAEHVILHDPYHGPSRRLTHAELLELWRPRYLNTEIVGNVLVAITDRPTEVPACALCGGAIPARLDCPSCGKPIPLQPAALLGCVQEGCPGRVANAVCCPFCDHLWSPSGSAAPAAAPPGPEGRLPNLDRLFAELEKFCTQILSLPAAAANPDVQRQLDHLKSCTDKLKLAESEEQVYRKMRQARMAQLEQKARQGEAAFLKKKEEAEQVAAPLDGNALGQALVNDLGPTGAVPPSPLPKESPPVRDTDQPQVTPRTREIVEFLKKTGRVR